MTNNKNFTVDLREPQPGDEVVHLGLDGEPSGVVSSIKQVLSSDHKLGMHEVLDNMGHFLIVTRSGPHRWEPVQEE